MITDAGDPGPEFDHMAIIVDLGESYIADVGFGDLFVEPIVIKPEPQFDGRNHFRIANEGSEMVIYMSADGQHYARKYTFTLTEVPLSSFEAMCYQKQVSPDSHFVKNTICTQLTERGRITVYNDNFTETIGDQKIQLVIQSEEELKEILKMRFGIKIGADR